MSTVQLAQGRGEEELIRDLLHDHLAGRFPTSLDGKTVQISDRERGSLSFSDALKLIFTQATDYNELLQAVNDGLQAENEASIDANDTTMTPSQRASLESILWKLIQKGTATLRQETHTQTLKMPKNAAPDNFS